MKPHSYYPHSFPTASPQLPHSFPTAPSRRRQALHWLRWLLLAGAVAGMATVAALTIARLASTQAQIDSAFLQGMQSGAQLCQRGV